MVSSLFKRSCHYERREGSRVHWEIHVALVSYAYRCITYKKTLWAWKILWNMLGVILKGHRWSPVIIENYISKPKKSTLKNDVTLFQPMKKKDISGMKRPGTENDGLIWAMISPLWNTQLINDCSNQNFWKFSILTSLISIGPIWPNIFALNKRSPSHFIWMIKSGLRVGNCYTRKFKWQKFHIETQWIDRPPALILVWLFVWQLYQSDFAYVRSPSELFGDPANLCPTVRASDPVTAPFLE